MCPHFGPALLLAVLFFLSPSGFLPAQDGTELRQVRLAWTADEYSLRYEVEVEKMEDGEYRKLFTEITEDSFIELSLAPGQYRCRVVPYDYLEKAGEGSQWMNFEIRAALAPEPPFAMAQPGPALMPVDSIPQDDEYGEKAPPAGYRKPFTMYLSAAWMPMLPIYEKDNPFFGPNLSLAGAGARLGALYSNLSYLDIGLELAGSWYAFSAHDDSYNAITAGLNLVAQKRIPNQIMALNFRLGAGLTFREDEKCFNTNLGISFLLYPHPRFFLEAGLEYTHLFTAYPPGCLRPLLGIGLQF